MSNYATAKDLKKFILQKCGELDDGTSEYDSRAITFLNRAHQALLSGGAELGIDVGQPWPWAQNRDKSVLVLQPKISTLTATFTNGSNAITFSSAPPRNLKDWIIQQNDFPECYRISAHTGTSTSATLDSIYVNTSGAGLSCVIFLIDYDLDPNILRLVAPFTAYKSNDYYRDNCANIDMIDPSEFARTFPINQLNEGTPNRFSQIYKTNDTMKPRIRINKIPDQLMRAEYNYIAVPADLTDSDSSIPLVPIDHRITLGYYGAYFLALDKNDNRAPEYRELAKAGIIALKRAGQVEKMNTDQFYGRMIPREDMLNRNRNKFGGTY